MFTKLFCIAALAISCVCAKPGLAPLAPLSYSAPLVAATAPAVVTAQSSQVVARNYNGIAPLAYTATAAVAAPLAAPLAYTAAPVAKVAAPLAYTAAGVPLAYSAPALAAAAPLVYRAGPIVSPYAAYSPYLLVIASFNQRLVNHRNTIKMFTKLICIAALAISCVCAKPGLAPLAPLAYSAPLVAAAAPAVVTAQSSQVVARNYNGIAPLAYTAAAPLAASLAYTSAPVAKVAAPLAYTAAGVPLAYSAPTLAAAAPLAYRAAPLLSPYAAYSPYLLQHMEKAVERHGMPTERPLPKLEQTLCNPPKTIKMFTKLFCIAALAVSCVCAKPGLAPLAPLAYSAPLVAAAAPAVVTAQSSQVVARNYNGIAPLAYTAAAPLAAPLAYTAAPVAKVAAPLAYTAAGVPLAYSAPALAAAAPLAYSAAPIASPYAAYSPYLL
ncbi:calphotin-like [Toxorhynchites rutilus septentrionalis]|uniref:calphotin-like n=2 Tax=Toxorhynchites rutilus septentrionalis TaxID=329112 RepID=UPI00247ADD28|nr:calphotin-like [Toxorhynchites rutilus septentrionalis]